MFIYLLKTIYRTLFSILQQYSEEISSIYLFICILLSSNAYVSYLQNEVPLSGIMGMK